MKTGATPFLQGSPPCPNAANLSRRCGGTLPLTETDRSGGSRMGSIQLDIDAVLDGADNPFLTGITDLAAQSDIVYAVSSDGNVSAWQLSDAGPELLDTASLPPPVTAGISPAFETMAMDGGVTLMATGSGGLWALDTAPDGSLSGAAAVKGGLPADLATCTTVVRNGETYMAGTLPGSEKPGLWKMDPDGSFAEVKAPGAGESHAAGITAMRGVELGGKAFVVATAGDSDALMLFKVESGGLTKKAVLGAEQGLGVDTPSALALAEVDGVTYALMGAAGSSTITVAALAPNGTMTLQDHVMDGLGTRFQGITALETAQVDGRTYVVAAGADDGLSLFELLPGGTLLHHATLADSTATTLDNIADLSLSVAGETLQITVASASEPGLTVLSAQMPSGRLVMGRAGDEALTGGSGDDVVVDGAGADTLTGGAGRDVFVLNADGQDDVIADFDPGEDSIDLSAWAFLRSPEQLTVVERSDGAEIWFGDERLVIQAASGKALTTAQVLALDLLPVDRMLPGWADTVTEPETPPKDEDDSGIGSKQGDFHDGGNGDSFFSGKGGSDTLRGNSGNDTLLGDAHSDYLDGGDGDDSLHGGQGADTMMGGNGNDIMEGKEGHDWIEGGPGDDTMSGDFDRDTMFGGSGNDSIKGVKGYDILYGGAGDDTLSGGEGYDELYGEDGYDRLEGGVSNDTMDGGNGDDVLLGNQGSDLMEGGAGDDSLRGHDGHDTISGGAGNDSLYGSAGRDVLDGGAGDDLLVGGSGADVFIFTGGNDTITDFDRVDLVQIDRDAWAGSALALLDGAQVTGTGVVLDMGPGDTVLIKGLSSAEMLDGLLEFF